MVGSGSALGERHPHLDAMDPTRTHSSALVRPVDTVQGRLVPRGTAETNIEMAIDTTATAMELADQATHGLCLRVTFGTRSPWAASIRSGASTGEVGLKVGSPTVKDQGTHNAQGYGLPRGSTSATGAWSATLTTHDLTTRTTVLRRRLARRDRVHGRDRPGETRRRPDRPSPPHAWVCSATVVRGGVEYCAHWGPWRRQPAHLHHRPARQARLRTMRLEALARTPPGRRGDL